MEGVVLGEKGHLLDQKQTVKGYGLRSHIVSTYGIYIFFILYFEFKKKLPVLCLSLQVLLLNYLFISYNFNAFLGIA